MCRPVEGVSVPEHDRRILESMAMKREAERAAEELAHEAHIAWEHARQEREQVRPVARTKSMAGEILGLPIF